MAQHNKREAAAAASFLSRRIVAPLTWLGGAISTLLILGAFGLIVAAVVRRYVFSAPIRFTDEVAGWALVAAIMFGAAEAYRQGDHISIDLVTARLPDKARRAMGVFSDLSVLAFAIAIGRSAWDAVTFARGFGMYTTGHIVMETWILQTPLIAGATLLGLAAMTKLAERFTGRRAP
ncbi:TRAP transporter small permease [Pikeienuella piscinae]|uniref:TRAP transporter small permease protein n=1 Tax=Pikeienuella piscinae TaxID=2748098 RepID=A0A7L5BXW7_9RHOB|nr:TRAP transporter small permease [Pikeienuella piscinae]QIE54449.1 TRAP transporter small permease [Pikeienuella piscinae]